VNNWLDLLDLVGPLLPALAVIAFAVDVFHQTHTRKKEIHMDKDQLRADVQKALKKADVNGDGRVDLKDAQQILEEQLARQRPAVVAGASFIGGLVVGFIAGRASK
jgi:flagellar biosynthesis protein FlhB